MDSKKKKTVALAIVIIISVALISSWYFYESNKKNKYYTMQEVGEALQPYGEVGLDKSKYYLKDDIIYLDKIKIPDYEFHNNGSTDISTYEIRFLQGKYVNLYAVGFKSMDSRPVFFSKNTGDQLKKGEIKFTLSVENYHSFKGYKTNSDEWRTVEPIYFTNLVAEYNLQISTGEFEILQTAKNVNIDSNNNSFCCNLTVEDITEYFPLPVKWNEINFDKNYYIERISNFSIQVYNEQNDLLGDLLDEQSKIDGKVIKGDRLKITGDQSKIEIEEISIHFYINIYYNYTDDSRFSILEPLSIDYSSG